MATEAQVQEITFDETPYGGAQAGRIGSPFRVTAMHRVAIAGGGGTNSGAAISLATRFIRVTADALCKLTFGTWNAAGVAQAPAVPSGTSGGFLIPPGVEQILEVPIPQKRTLGTDPAAGSFLADAATGVLFNIRDTSP